MVSNLLVLLATVAAASTQPNDQNQLASIMSITRNVRKPPIGAIRTIRIGSSGVVIIPLDGHNLVEYFLNVSIGTPPVFVQLQVDTGSSVTVVPSAACFGNCPKGASYNTSNSNTAVSINCSSPACSAKRCFVDAHQTSQCLFNASYEDGTSLVGALTQDLFNISTLQSSAIFGRIERYARETTSGILGLAFGSKSMTCLPNCMPPVLNSMVADSRNKLTEKVFALHLGNDNPQFIVGHPPVDPASPIVYTPIMAADYYSIDLKRVRLGTTTVASSSAWQYIVGYKNPFGRTIVDSGTTLLLFPPQVFHSFEMIIQPYLCVNITPCDPNEVWGHVPAKIVDTLPTLVFEFHGMTNQLTPRQYCEMMDDGYFQVLISSTTDENNRLTILGDTYMRQFLVIFDQDKHVIGMSNSTRTAVSLMDWFTQHTTFFAVTVGVLFGSILTSLCLCLTCTATKIWDHFRKPPREGYSEIPIPDYPPQGLLNSTNAPAGGMYGSVINNPFCDRTMSRTSVPDTDL